MRAPFLRPAAASVATMRMKNATFLNAGLRFGARADERLTHALRQIWSSASSVTETSRR
jgi:hypothetical protein